MPRRLALALSISALLIISAAGLRVSSAGNRSKTLTVVNVSNSPATGTSTDSTDDTTIVDASLDDSSGGATPENLTTTDLVTRQLMSQYLDLASNGQATDATIQELADNIAGNIASLNSFAPLTPTQIKIASDTKANFKAYGDALNAIHTKYQGLAAGVVTAGGDLSDITSKNFISTMVSLGKLEKRSADELALLPVPASLADAHLKLINNYISSSNALTAIGNVNTDSATAFAGLMAQSNSSDEEESILLGIQTSLLAQSISFTP